MVDAHRSSPTYSPSATFFSALNFTAFSCQPCGSCLRTNSGSDKRCRNAHEETSQIVSQMHYCHHQAFISITSRIVAESAPSCAP